MEKERLSETDRLKEEIRFKTEWTKFVGGTTVLTLGGTFALMIDGPDRGREIVFCVFGILVSVVLMVYCGNLYFKLKRLIGL